VFSYEKDPRHVDLQSFPLLNTEYNNWELCSTCLLSFSSENICLTQKCVTLRLLNSVGLDWQWIIHYRVPVHVHQTGMCYNNRERHVAKDSVKFMESLIGSNLKKGTAIITYIMEGCNTLKLSSSSILSSKPANPPKAINKCLQIQ